MTVNPQGGQFQCPACHAINAVGAQGIPMQHMAAPPKPPTDNRKGYVFGGFVGLGVLAIGMGWSGMLIGLPLLGWGIAGAMGKVKGPGALVFPESADKSGIGALGVGLGAFVMTCSVLGGTSAAETAAKEERLAVAKIEREAAEKVAEEKRAVEEEKRAAEEVAAKAAHEAELRANVKEAAAAYKTGLDSAEALMADGKVHEAVKELEAVMAAVKDYRELDPVPEGIAALVPRHATLMPKVTEAVKVTVAAAELKTDMAKAANLTKGSKDGAAWSTAQGLWQSALKNIETLENAGEAHKARVPAGLPGTRKAIEKNLSKAQGIVAKYEAAQAARDAYKALCGNEGCIEVTATQLLKDYANNEAGAQARWGGKRVSVSGIVDSVSLDLFDNPVVSIRGRNRYSFTSVMCDPENPAAANTLSKGQKIVAIGTVGSEIIGSVGLDDCVF